MSKQCNYILSKSHFYKSLILVLIINALNYLLVSAKTSRVHRNFDLINYNVEQMYRINATTRQHRQIMNHLTVVNLSEFVAKVKGGIKKATELADKFNLKLVKRVFDDSDYFLFEKETIQKDKTGIYKNTGKRVRRSLETDEVHTLQNEPMIEWIEEQVPKSRKKRDYMDYDDRYMKPLSQEDQVNNEDLTKFNDPMWAKLWYINHNTHEHAKSPNSMRVKEAWKKGYTGKGVIVTILDDGLEWDHPDLIKNYDFRASLDINDGDNDPKPRYDRYNYNKHGTRCAGEIAAVADNNICSIGVAYNSHIGGIRMLDGEVTDLVEATALSYNRDYIDIYSASWGPDDDGKTVDGPGYLALKAIEDGIKYVNF